MAEVLIAPSLLAGDFARLGEEVASVEAAGADWLHLDVMDGVFVPNLTFGAPVVAALRPHTALFLDVHLMIVEPERHLQAFAEAGADAITVHVEACRHLHRTLSQIRALGKRAGVALNPATGWEALPYVLDMVDLILVMSVNPGFGGQSFIPGVLPKLKALRNLVNQAGHPIHLSVDGGIDPRTAGQVTSVGADVLVAGSAVFGAADREQAIRALREGARAQV